MSNMVRHENKLLEPLFDDMERNFDRLLSFYSAIDKEVNCWLPYIDIQDVGDYYDIKVDIPGVDKRDIKINVDEYSNLIITGERESESKPEEKKYIYWERNKGSFFRKITLPSIVDAENIKATYRSGILEIKAPKAKESITKCIKIED